MHKYFDNPGEANEILMTTFESSFLTEGADESALSELRATVMSAEIAEDPFAGK